MDFETLRVMANENNIRRNNLRREADQKFEKPEEKLAYVCRELLKNYIFDYSNLKGLEELQNERPYEPQEFESEGKSYTIKEWTDDNNAVETLDENNEFIGIDKQHRVYHFIHTLKRGTCISFSAEVDWYANQFGIKSERVHEGCWCYDGYFSVPEDKRIRRMSHYYNRVNIDGEDYIVDIAGALMAMDYNKSHKDEPLDPAKFMFIPETEFKNQFAILANANKYDQ